MVLEGGEVRRKGGYQNCISANKGEEGGRSFCDNVIIEWPFWFSVAGRRKFR